MKLKLTSCVFLFLFCVYVEGCSNTMDMLQCAAFFECKMFVNLVRTTNLTTEFSGGTNKTLFLPPDKSFKNIPEDVLKNTTIMSDILRYHLVDTSMNHSKWKNDDLLATTNKGFNIRVNIYRDNKTTISTVSGAWLIVPGQKSTNGEVNLLDKVMYPLPTQNLFSLVASTTNKFSTLLLLITKGGVQSLLQEGPYTLFAPNNEAFAKLPPGTIHDLTTDIPKLKAVLLQHVVGGTVYTRASRVLHSVVNLADSTLSYGDGKIGDSRLVGMVDASAVNGVLHEIDTVLLPKI